MGWWNGQGTDQARLAALESVVASLRVRVEKAEATASEAAERAYKHLKRAETRARRELDESGTAPGGTDLLKVQNGEQDVLGRAVTPSGSQRGLWGARSRRLARLTRRDPADEAAVEE